MKTTSTMAARAFLLAAAILFTALPAAAADALSWLGTQQNADGSYGGTPASLATLPQATAEVLHAQLVLSQASTPSYAAGLAFLDGLSGPHAELLARRISADSAAGNPFDVTLAALLALQNPDGGFADLRGQDSTVLSTAFALDAVGGSGRSPSSVRGAVSFLLGRQRADGSFADGAGGGSVYVTALAMRAIQPQAGVFAGIASALAAAQDFLLSQRATDALWGEDFVSAMALLASAASLPDISTADSTAAALRARQGIDGSWDGDAFTTALAIQALAAYESRKAGSPGLANGSIAGHVVHANGTEPIGQATVSIAEAPGTAVLTNANGYYVLPALPAGRYTVTASRAGYTSASALVATVGGEAAVAPDLILDLAPQTGLFRGLVFDAGTRQPLAGVQLSLSGSSARSVLSDAAGGFDFGPLTPGSYALTFTLAGYETMSGSANVVAGQTLITQLGMIPAGGFKDPSPGVVQGRIVDARTGQPIPGAGFNLGGSTATAGADGSFALAGVARGAYAATARAAGYQSINLNITFPPGASGDLGTLSLYAAADTQPPTSLNLRVSVVDGVSGAAVAAAHVTLVETAVIAVAGADGQAAFTGVAIKSFNLLVSAAGYDSQTFGVNVAAFGDAAVTLRLSPPGSGATVSTLSGMVTDASTGAPIGGATVSAGGTTLAAAGADGKYSLPGISPLDFAVSVSAVGFEQQTFNLHLTARGAFTLDAALQPVAGTAFQVVSVAAGQDSNGANATATFTARVASLLSNAKTVLVLGEVQDPSGAAVAKVLPFAPGTSTPAAQLTFAAGEVKDLVVPWNTAQFAPGIYRLVLRVVEPGTISRGAPLGQVLAENGGYGKITATQTIAGGLDVNPPLTQAGLPTPIAFTAVLQNGGNVPLPAGTYELTVTKSDDGTLFFTSDVDAPALDVSASEQLAFGAWTPQVTAAGNLIATVRRKADSIQGTITGQLYIGDKASGTFTVDRSVVPEGTQTVHGRVAMTGVDTSRGSSTDPLINLVRNSVGKGGSFVAPAAVNWLQSNRCLGCHILSQSVLGLSSSFDKGDIDRAATTQLFNAVASSQWLDGALRISHPEFAKTQTELNLWALGSWPDKQNTFRIKVKAAQFLQNVKLRSGDQTRWTADHFSGWWDSDQANTSMTLKSYAGILRDAQQISLPEVVDYTLGAAKPFGSGFIVGMQAGPDGALYLAANGNGIIYRMDPATFVSTPLHQGLPGDLLGLAFAPDGTLYVTTNSGTLIRFNPDGSRAPDRIVGGVLADVKVGPDGLVYLSDFANHRILRLNPAGQVEVFAGGGLFNSPHGIAFDAAGTLLVANYNGYGILAVGRDGKVSNYAQGLAYRPIRVALVPDGTLFVTNGEPYSNGGAYRVHPDGTAERVFQREGVLALAAVGSQLYFANNNDRTVSPLSIAPMDLTPLAALRNEIPFGVRFLLAGAGDANGDNTIHAQRLIGLAEARDQLDDPALSARVDAAVAAEATLLRARQNADGGWPRFNRSVSDPLVTAMVGNALEYTSPSATDPQIRATIAYLLNRQLPDGSWDNFNNGLTTRLASTSFVMIFMPKALERLGGIDVGLKLKLASNVRLANPTLAPASVTTNPDQTTDYAWSLLGVTTAGRQVDFDLTLADLALHESRPAALSASLAFNNSFVDRQIELPLDVPSVRAESGLALAVATDRTAYGAGQPVLISSTVSNGGAGIASGQVALAVRGRGAGATVATLPTIVFSGLAPGAPVSLPSSWNTGTTLAGDYEVYGQLLDATGRVLLESTAPLRIAAPAIAATAMVSTDRRLYGAFDAVAIAGEARNSSANALLPAAVAELTVVAPSGAIVFFEARDVDQLTPQAFKALSYSLRLADADAGSYAVTLVLKDRFTRAPLASAGSTFAVQRQAEQGLSGAVAVRSAVVEQGDDQVCTETTRNLSAAPLLGARLIHRLIAADTGAILGDEPETLDLPGGGQPEVFTHRFATTQLTPGGYACLLLAQGDSGARTLATAGFTVVQPPVKLTASMSLGGRGRLLVFLDGDGMGCGDDDRGGSSNHTGDDDGDGSSNYTGNGCKADPAFSQRRAFLEALLRADGFSYTIVTSALGFTRELRTGGYREYAAISSAGRLDNDTQAELREAVFAGDGFLVSGTSNEHMSRLRDALGVKLVGHVEHAVSIVPASAASPMAGTALLDGEHPLRVRLQGAASLALYQLAPSWPVDDHAGCGDDGDDHGPDGRYGTSASECHGELRDAVTLDAYGRGQAAFAGVDLLGMAMRDGEASAAADDLRTVLHLIAPAGFALAQGAVVPVQVTVVNQGIAVPVTVTAALPVGVRVIDGGGGQQAGTTLTFSLQLEKGAAATVRYWVRLPAGQVTLAATVSAVHGRQTFVTSADLALSPVAPPSLAALQATADALTRSDPGDANALRKVSAELRKASSRRDAGAAFEDGLDAADALLGTVNSEVRDLRFGLDAWLRSAAQTLPPP